MSEYKYLSEKFLSSQEAFKRDGFVLILHDRVEHCIKGIPGGPFEYVLEEDKGKNFFVWSEKPGAELEIPATYRDYPLFWEELRRSGTFLGFGNTELEAIGDFYKRLRVAGFDPTDRRSK